MRKYFLADDMRRGAGAIRGLTRRSCSENDWLEWPTEREKPDSDRPQAPIASPAALPLIMRSRVP
jgi:hypothetical protein